MIFGNTLVQRSFGYVAVLLLLACNSNEKKGEDSIKIGTNESIEEPVPAIAEKSNSSLSHDTVVIKGMQFLPANVQVKKGDTVVWINKDIVVHDVSDYPDKKWTSGPLQTGNTWKMKIEKSNDYFCSIHITMKGKVTVDP